MSDGAGPRHRGRFAAASAGLILLIAAVTYGSMALDTFFPSGAERELPAFTPSAERPDPSTAIVGVRLQDIRDREHVATTDEPGYETRPPVGGPHGDTWAACSGLAYPEPVRDADAVHSLEHGAVWVTYDPAHRRGHGPGPDRPRQR